MHSETPLPERERNLKFKDLSERLSKIAASESLDLAPFDASELPNFSLMTAVDQQMALTALEDYLDVCEEAKKNGFSLRDTKAMFMRMLKTMNLTLGF